MTGTAFQIPQAHSALQQGRRALARFCNRHAAYFHAQGHIVDHRSPRQQKVLLQHVADLADHPGRILTVDQDATGSWMQQSGDNVEDRALTAPRRPDQGDEATSGHLADRQAPTRRIPDPSVLKTIETLFEFQSNGIGHEALH